MQWRPGTRRASRCDVSLRRSNGEVLEIELEPTICFQMLGLGYTHPEWGHGRYHAELEIGGEQWKLADLDPLALQHNHIQQVVRARCGELEGMGVLEQIAMGPHTPSGLTGFLDGAS
jgi:hypothetical protein